MRFMAAVVTAAVAGAAAVTTGCTAARMAAPRELEAQGAGPLAVERRTGPFEGGHLSFGEHRVRDYARGWSFSWSPSFGGVTFTTEHDPYSFRLTGGEAGGDGGEREVQCAGRGGRLSSTREGQVGGLPVSRTVELNVQPRRLECGFGAGGPDGAGGALVVEHVPGWDLSEPRGRVQGRAWMGGQALTVESTSRLEGGGMLAFTGFHLREEGRLVAAVETLNEGRVWLAPDLAPRTRTLAVLTASALLLDPTWQGPLD
jgi:hypothetical protein